LLRRQYILCTSQILDPTAKIRIIAIFVSFSYEENCAGDLFTCTWSSSVPVPHVQLKLFIAYRHQTDMRRGFSHGCCLAASHSTKIRPQQNMTTTKYYHCNSPIFSSSITTDYCSDPSAIRSHEFPWHHPVTALSSWPVTRYSLWRSSLSVSRNVVKIGQTVSEGRSTCGTHSLSCNIEKLFIAFRARHKSMAKFLTHRKHTTSPRQRSRI